MIPNYQIITNFFCPTSQYHGPGHGFFNQWGHMMPFGGIFFWILLFLAVMILIFVISKGRNPGFDKDISRQETPLDILKKRYARGELTREDFDRMKNELK